MSFSSPPTFPRRGTVIEPTVLAEFTDDMVKTLAAYFDQYSMDGVVTVEVTVQGLWLHNPNDQSKQFLGLARLPRKGVH